MAKKISKPYIHGKNLELLKQLIQDGYVYTANNRTRLRFLQKIFPSIRRSQYKHKSVYYLDGKNKLALKEMIKQNESRVINYHELSRASKAFKTDLSKTEKKRFFGKKEPISRKRKQRSKEKQNFFSKEKNKSLDEFFGRFLHSDVLRSSSSEGSLK